MRAQDRGLSFSGTLDTRIAGALGEGEGPDFSLGLEGAANLRFQAPLREWGTFYGALNLIAASGSIAAGALGLGGANAAAYPGLAPSAFAAGENYIAALELERLYFRVQGEAAQLDTGLLRIPFGYSLAWGPSDFLNPRSPLLPDARPRGVLGLLGTAYPSDTMKLSAFAAAPRDPLSIDGGGAVLGIGGEKHWDRGSLQGLYAYEAPAGPYSWGRHRGGLSVKADLELGFVGEALYTYDHQAETGLEGLAAAGGFDYSFLGGDLYVLAEYLYSGEKSSAAENLGLGKRHYLTALGSYSFNDYTRLSLSCVAGLGDSSFSPVLGLEYEPFQGLTLNFSAQVPLDRAVFSAGDPGELGPENTRTRALFTAKARLRF
jgi:hypothetical protein